MAHTREDDDLVFQPGGLDVQMALDAQRYPAEQLLEIYHRRWQAETCYFSLKSTILDGHVLRSRSVPGLEQEIFALLTVYQVLIRMAGDVTTARPGLPAERLSFVTLF
ncbi:transposase [Streptomyces sp. NPDC058424]|uniref:transposase n=1 Tax=Streptomyces sp. NPDC058424 TaxID=3346491 RepID=UPI00365DFBE3